MPGTAMSWRSLPGPARSRRRSAARSTTETAAAASRAAEGASARGITSVTGAQGGPTTLSNLAMLCRHHHRAVHEAGYQLDRAPDGELWFHRPDGRLLPEVPSPPEVLGDPVTALRARHDAKGLVLHARTA